MIELAGAYARCGSLPFDPDELLPGCEATSESSVDTFGIHHRSSSPTSSNSKAPGSRIPVLLRFTVLEELDKWLDLDCCTRFRTMYQ